AEVVPHPADVLHQVPWRPVTGGKGRPGGPGLGAVDHPFPPVVTRVIEVGQHGALSPDTSVPRTTALRRVSRRQLEQPAGAVERTRLGGLGGPFQLPLVAGDLFRQQGGLGRHIGANTDQQQEDHRDEQDHALLAPGGYGGVWFHGTLFLRLTNPQWARRIRWSACAPPLTSRPSNSSTTGAVARGASLANSTPADRPTGMPSASATAASASPSTRR